MKRFAEKFQQVSVDEAYLLPGPEIRNFEDAALYALGIKDEIQKQVLTFTAFLHLSYTLPL